MSSIGKTAVLAILASIIAQPLSSLSVVLAQELGEPNPLNVPGAQFFRPYRSNPAFEWLGVKAVQDELKLTDTQKDKISSAQVDFERRMRDLNSESGRGFPGAGPNAGSPAALNVAESGRANKGWIGGRQLIERDIDKTYSKILTREQIQRLNQVDMQHEGPVVIINRPEIMYKLNISDEQLIQLKAAHSEIDGELQMRNELSRARMKEIRDGARKTLSPEQKKQFAALSEEQVKQYSAANSKRKAAFARILTKRQQATFDKLLGEPFDISKLDDAQRERVAAHVKQAREAAATKKAPSSAK